MGNPKPTNIFMFHKFISSLLSHVEKITEFNGVTILLQMPSKNTGDITMAVSN